MVAISLWQLTLTKLMLPESGSELWPQREKHCDNVYFDITPAKFISGFITEEGIRDVAGMEPYVQKWRRLSKDFDI